MAFGRSWQEARRFDFEGGNRKEIYEWVRQTVIEQQYHVQGKAAKGLLRGYITKMTGLSRAQVTRLIGQYLATGKVEEKGYLRRRFPKLYTRRDIELLAEVDEAHEKHSAGPRRRRSCTGRFTSFENPPMRGSRNCRWRISTTCAGRAGIANGGLFIRARAPRR